MAALLAACLVLVPGCISFDGSGDVDVRIIVTQDVGTEILVDENLTLRQGASAMDALHEAATVETRYGGGFVHAIDGIESQYPDRKLDWFYHVDTRLAGVGAAQYTLEDGDLVVFDHRDWSRTMHLEHVLTGLEDWPLDLEDPAFDRPAFEDAQTDEDTRDELYARVDGDELMLLDTEGKTARNLSAPWLLAHAVDGPGDRPRILLVPSGEEARSLAPEMAARQPTGVGLVLTPNASLEVPAG